MDIGDTTQGFGADVWEGRVNRTYQKERIRKVWNIYRRELYMLRRKDEGIKQVREGSRSRKGNLVWNTTGNTHTTIIRNCAMPLFMKVWIIE